MRNYDLAELHAPINNLFPALDIAESRVSHGLSESQLTQFETDGYVAGVRLLTETQIEALHDQLGLLANPFHEKQDLWHEFHSNESTDPNKILFHALGAWRLEPAFHDLLWNPAFTTPASQLLGGSVRFWHDQLFCKPARHGGVVAWHQDYSYWTRTSPMQHLTCWIGLDDATRDNGCLQYVPGSHKWDLLPITGLAGDMHAIREVLDDEQWHQLNNPVAIELKAGECAFHHPLMVHGSFANTTAKPRRATVLNVVRDGVCSTQDEPLLNGADPIKAGQPLQGKFFPMLFDCGSVTK